MRVRSTWFLSALACSVMCSSLWTSLAAAEASYVWVEAEDGAETNLTDKHPNVSHHKALSGGVSIGINPSDSSVRKWKRAIDVPGDGTYQLYVHKFWKHGPFRWRFDNGEWTSLTKDATTLIESEGLDQKHQAISWVNFGEATLKGGSRVLEIEGLDKDGAFVLDCFVLSRDPFVPMGLRKPGEKSGLADAGKWAFEPDYDSHDREPVIDLRGLNEAVAGENGFVRRSVDGADFVNGAGKPIRFWSIGTNIHRTEDLKAIGRQAANLAKRGVNMVRLHGHISPGKGSKLTDVDKGEIDRCWKLVAGMKAQGIYTTFSPYWGTHTTVEDSWGYTKGSNGRMTAVLFFDPEIQAAYKGWWRALLTEKNPYTGIALKDDPALAILQLQNEDSLLFHTMSGLGPEATKQIEALYAAWLTKNGKKTPAKLLPIWKLCEDRGRGDNEQMANQIEFYTETMFAFNAMMGDYFKELGCKQLVNAGNWKPGDITKLGDAERYSYTANDIIGVNRYVNGGGERGGHVNVKDNSLTGYQINVGDLYADESVTQHVGRLAYNLKQVAGFPMMVYESCWVPPMSKQAEGPFLIAAYGCLTGVDSYYWFCTGSEQFAPQLGKWEVADPMQMGGFPAASYLFRKGLLQQGKPVVQEQRSLDSMWNRDTPIISEEMGYDPNRDANFINPKSSVAAGIDPRAFLVGPVEVTYGSDPAKSTAVDLKPYLKKDRIDSVTGELAIDTAKGLCYMTAPRAQGVTGHLDQGGRMDLGALTVQSKNDYGSVIAVSLDDAPLAKSKRIFLQVTTRARPHGWKDVAGDFPYDLGKSKGTIHGFQIRDVGGAPWNIDNTQITITLANPGVKTITLCDANLYPVEKIKSSVAKGVLTCELPANAMYLLIE